MGQFFRVTLRLQKSDQFSWILSYLPLIGSLISIGYTACWFLQSHPYFCTKANNIGWHVYAIHILLGAGPENDSDLQYGSPFSGPKISNTSLCWTLLLIPGE